MAVVDFGREPGFPTTRYTLQNKRVTPTHSDRWKILVNDETDTGVTIYAQTPFQIGVEFADGTKIRDVAFSRSKENRLLWFADLTFGDVSDEEDDDRTKPPDQRKPVWSWDYETLPRSITVDVDGQAIQTSAGDPIEHEGLLVIPVLTIERLQLSFDPDVIINYFNRTNQSAFWGAPSGTALMSGIRDREDSLEVFGGIRYRRVSYTIKFALPFIADVLEGWKDLLVDHGWHYLVSGEKKPILEGSTRVSRNLNGSGGLLDPGDPPHILKFNNHQSANFDALGINLGQF